MKLRIKNLNWTAGKPVVFLNDKTARRLNVFVDDRLMLSNGHKVHAIVDLFPKIIKSDEIGVSQEVSSIIKLKSGGLVDGFRNGNYEGGAAAEEIYDFASVFSVFYEELEQWYDEVNAEWLRERKKELEDDDDRWEEVDCDAPFLETT